MYSWVHMSLVFDNDLNVNGGGWGTGLWKPRPREEWLSGTRVLVLGKSGVRAAVSVKMVVSRGFDISDFYRLGVSTVGSVLPIFQVRLGNVRFYYSNPPCHPSHRPSLILPTQLFHRHNPHFRFQRDNTLVIVQPPGPDDVLQNVKFDVTPFGWLIPKK